MTEGGAIYRQIDRHRTSSHPAILFLDHKYRPFLRKTSGKHQQLRRGSDAVPASCAGLPLCKVLTPIQRLISHRSNLRVLGGRRLVPRFLSFLRLNGTFRSTAPHPCVLDVTLRLTPYLPGSRIQVNSSQRVYQSGLVERKATSDNLVVVVQVSIVTPKNCNQVDSTSSAGHLGCGGVWRWRGSIHGIVTSPCHFTIVTARY